MDTLKEDASSDTPLDPQKTNRAALELLARVRELLNLDPSAVLRDQPAAAAKRHGPDLSAELRARLAEASKKKGRVRHDAAKELRRYRATDATEGPWHYLRGRENRRTLRLASRRGAQWEVVEAWLQEQRVPLRAATERLAAWVAANEDVLIGEDVQLANLTCTSWHEALVEIARSVDEALGMPSTSTDRHWKLDGLLLPWAAWEKLARDLRREWARVAQHAAAASKAVVPVAPAPEAATPAGKSPSARERVQLVLTRLTREGRHDVTQPEVAKLAKCSDKTVRRSPAWKAYARGRGKTIAIANADDLADPASQDRQQARRAAGQREKRRVD